MDRPIFQLMLLEPARDFIKRLPANVKEKVYYNIKKIQGGVMDRDLLGYEAGRRYEIVFV